MSDRTDRTPDDPVPTFEAFLPEYLAWSRVHHAESTHRTGRRLVEGVLLRGLRERRLDRITTRDLDRLISRLDGVSAATRNRVLTAASTLFRRAQAMGYVASNPARGIERGREPIAPIPLVSLEQQDRLIELLPEHKRLLFLTALETGARLGELLRLRWRDVDTSQRVLLLRRTKAGAPRLLRMSARLEASLHAARSRVTTDAPDERMFEAAIGSDDCLRWTWRKAFKRAAAAIGFPELRVHDLRHLTAVSLVRAGVDLPTVQAFLGHRHLVSTLRYAAYADETATARAARALDRIRNEDKEAT